MITFLTTATFNQMGGIQRFNMRVIDCLEALDRSYQIATFNDSPKYLTETLSSRVQFISKKNPIDLIKLVFSSKKSKNILIGHINILPLFFIIKLINTKVRGILFVHGIDVWNDSKYRKKKFYDSFILRYVDIVASVSRYTADIMIKEYNINNKKVKIFPNVTDKPVLKRNIKREPKNILCVSRMGKYDYSKNIHLVIKSFENILDKHTELRLQIVGDGPLKEQLESTVSYKNTDRIEFLGRVSDEKLQQLYSEAYLFVLPSDKEGFGIVYLEAWRFSLPVICSKYGASSEVIDDGINGIVCDTKDTIDIQNALIKLVSDESLATKMGVEGNKKLVSKYLPDNMVDNLREILN